MFFKLATVFALVAATFAAPNPGSGSGSSTCSTGTQQCCDSIAVSDSDKLFALLLYDRLMFNCVQPTGSANSGDLAGLIPINLQGLGVPIGLNW